MFHWIPSYPRDRLAFMLADAQPLVLLTTLDVTGDSLPLSKTEEVCLDRFAEHTCPTADERPASGKRPGGRSGVCDLHVRVDWQAKRGANNASVRDQFS